MTDLTPQYQALHEVYCRETGLHVPLTMQRIWKWEQWLVNKFTKEDLSLVIRHIQGLVKDKRRWENSLYFRNLIEDTERFSEDLAEAKARSRPHAPATIKVRTGSTERIVSNPNTHDTSKPVDAVLSKLELVNRLKQLRESL